MRAFNLELAKQGYPVVTMAEKSVRVICWDHKYKRHGGPIIALISGKSKAHEMIIQYNLDGTQVDNIHTLDLQMKDDYEIPTEKVKSPLTKLEEEKYANN